MKGYKLDRNGANGAYGAYGANGAYGAYGANGAHGAYGAYGAHGVAALFLILSLTIFCACSSDSSEEMPVTPTTSVPVELMSCVTPFEEDVATTRAAGNWIPPTGYELFGDNQSIGICFTQNNKEPMTGYFFKSSGKWRSTVELTSEQAGTYYLYGYTPHNASLSCTISSSATPGDNSNYSNGAVLTINNLPSITAEDVCIVVGAKNGKSFYQANADYEVPPLVRGDFDYYADPIPTSMSGKANYVYLLLEHIYAALNVRMRVEGNYNALRTIKLKKLELATMATTISGGVPTNVATKKKTDATVTLVKTTDGSSPITNVVFTPRGEEVGSDSVFSSTDGLELTTDYSDYLSHFMPSGVSTLILTTTYDVYDKKNNLVRKNAKATNTLVLSKLLTGQDTALPGRRYNVSLTIHPTYLYVMSDPDLDNPMITVE